MKLFAFIAAAAYGYEAPVAAAPAAGFNMATNPMLMYSLLSGDSTDMKSMLPFMMMSGQGQFNPMMYMMMKDSSGDSSSLKEMLPLMMMSGQGGDINSMLPFLLMGDNSELKVNHSSPVLRCLNIVLRIFCH